MVGDPYTCFKDPSWVREVELDLPRIKTCICFLGVGEYADANDAAILPSNHRECHRRNGIL